MTTPAERARELYADAIAARGPAWSNTAANIRAGFSNVWIAPALDAIERVVRRCPDEGDEETKGVRG